MAPIRPGRALFSPPREPVQQWSKCCFVLTPLTTPESRSHPAPPAGHLISDGHPHPGSRLQVLLGLEIGHMGAGFHLLLFPSVIACTWMVARQARDTSHLRPPHVPASLPPLWLPGVLGKKQQLHP